MQKDEDFAKGEIGYPRGMPMPAMKTFKIQTLKISCKVCGTELGIYKGTELYIVNLKGSDFEPVFLCKECWHKYLEGKVSF